MQNSHILPKSGLFLIVWFFMDIPQPRKIWKYCLKSNIQSLPSGEEGRLPSQIFKPAFSRKTGKICDILNDYNALKKEITDLHEFNQLGWILGGRLSGGSPMEVSQ